MKRENIPNLVAAYTTASLAVLFAGVILADAESLGDVLFYLGLGLLMNGVVTGCAWGLARSYCRP